MTHCNLHIRALLTMLILGIFSQVQAGEPLMVVQSSIHKYSVKLHGNGELQNSYEWTVTRREKKGLQVIENVDYEVVPIAYAGVNEVYIKWLKEGEYNLHVTESTAAHGCQNSRTVPVSVVQNTLSYEPIETTFESCYNDEQQVTVSINTFFNEDKPLENKYFPLNVKLDIYDDNILLNKEVEISNPGDELIIGQLNEDPDNETTYVITITEITDRFGTVLSPRNDENVIFYTIHSKPRITFSSK